MDASTLFYLSKIATAAAAASHGGSNTSTANEMANSYDPLVFNAMADAYLRKLYSDSFFNSTASLSTSSPSGSTTSLLVSPGGAESSAHLNSATSSCNTSSSSTSSSPSSSSTSIGKHIKKRMNQ